MNKCISKNSRVWIFVGLLGILLLFNGLYYENVNDGVLQVFISGLFSNGRNALPDSFGCFVLISRPLNYLYKTIPNVNWYDIFQVAVLGVSSFSIGWLILKETATQLNSGQLTVFAIPCAVILGEFFLPVEFTQSAFLLGFTAILYLENSEKVFSSKSLFWGAAFLLATLIRIESVVAVVISYKIFCVFNGVYANTATLRKNTNYIFAIIVVSLLANIPKSSEEAYYIKIRGYEYALADFTRQNTQSEIKSKKDSMVFFCATQFFFSDSSQSNPAFFKKVHTLGFDKTPTGIYTALLNFKISNNKVVLFNHILLGSKELFVFFIATFIAAAIVLPKRQVALLAVSLFVEGGLIFIISLVLKPEAHVIRPFFACLALLNIILIIQKSKSDSFRGGLQAFILTSTSLSLVSNQCKTVHSQQMRATYFQRVQQSITLQNSYGPVVLNVTVWDNMHYQMFSDNISNLQNTFIFDNGILYFNQGYVANMVARTGTAEYIRQIQLVFNNPQTKIYSTESRIKLILSYLKIMYNISYKVEKVSCFQQQGQDNPICIFKIMN